MRTQRRPQPWAEASGGGHRTRAGGCSGFRVRSLPGQALWRQRALREREGETPAECRGRADPPAWRGAHCSRGRLGGAGSLHSASPGGRRDLAFSVLRWHRPGFAEQKPRTRAACRGVGVTMPQDCEKLPRGDLRTEVNGVENNSSSSYHGAAGTRVSTPLGIWSRSGRG